MKLYYKNFLYESIGIPETIEVGGIMRSTRNSIGRLIYHSLEGIENFWRWFGDSEVVDDSGRPIICYHGTNADFSEFDISHFGKNDSGWYGKGFYFTPSTDFIFAEDAVSSQGFGYANEMPVYLKIKNPVYGYAYAEQGSNLVGSSINRGGDGVIIRYDPGHNKEYEIAEIVIISPNQIKSATGNSGSFSSSLDITKE
jgi:hypothetical protein